MELSFWYLALIVGILTWTTCTFLRAVATRTKQLREQVIEQLLAAREAEKDKSDDEIQEVGGEPAMAMVLDAPTPNQQARTSQANKSQTGGNGTSKNPNGHANQRGLR